ncbi:MAG: flavodoxin family protein [Ruminococcaceae bacterium]|nr:flavodoxin family protein [Oscillospiraceae bacterium]
MKVFVVYCHPSEQSFTCQVYRQFVRGLREAGHEVIISDLYKMDFCTDMTEEEYLRETHYRAELPVPEDVRQEQEKIQSSDAVAFIYPVFWTEAPAKLVGWFDRVWTSGFAYTPNPTMKVLDKALVLACAGKTMDSLAQSGQQQAMTAVMLGDRINERAKEKDIVFFDGITHWDEETRERLMPAHLERAYRLGLEF